MKNGSSTVSSLIDAVDDGFRARALPLEREYQRVSISGEEKCGVRQLSNPSLFR